MSNSKFSCNYCGVTFSVDEDTLQMYEEGWIERPSYCEECGRNLMEHYESELYSDADNGL